MFTPETYCAGQGASDFRSDLATYKTEDAIADVTAEGYFPTIPGRELNPPDVTEPVGEYLRGGDYVYIDADDATGIFYCIAVGDDLQVVTIGLDNIPAP